MNLKFMLLFLASVAALFTASSQKITLSLKDATLNLKFTQQVQFIFCPPESDVIFAIPNGWGRQGWTTINLKKANKKLVRSALEEAYKLRKEK